MSIDNSISQFYNDFSRKVLLRGFRDINARIEAIKALCDRFVAPGAAVLEVGCGVGILSKHLKHRASKLLSVDISDTNIKVASAYAGGGGADFRVMDVLSGEIDGTFDAVVLPDVIEHIPAANHDVLLRKLEACLRPGGVMILTFPSPEYQHWLRTNKPEALQIVDESVSPLQIMSKSSLMPIYLAYVSIFGRHDYVHLVLARDIEFSPELPEGGLMSRAMRRLRQLAWRLRHARFLRRIQNVL